MRFCRVRGITIPMVVTLMSIVITMTVSPATAETSAVVSAAQTLDSADPDGPHSPPDRVQAPTQVTTAKGATVRSADFGDIALGDGDFRTPVRGYLVTPTAAPRDTPLIVVAHLRYPACADFVSAYPCDGPEMRFDSGMVYLGKALAQRGYSVLIPDLSPVYVGDSVTGAYDQTRGVSQLLNRMISELDDAVAGHKTRWGTGLEHKVDASRVGLIAHSRSGQIAGDLTRLWSDSAHPIISILDYGPAFDVSYGGNPGTSPAIPDVPLLVTLGDQDRDTEFMGAMWLSKHIAQRRATPALLAITSGLGHTYVNRSLSKAEIDDRICDDQCASVEEHEKFLIGTATQWFDATMLRHRTTLPLFARSSLPATLGGRPARWLAVTNGPRRNVYLAAKHGSVKPFGAAGEAHTCFPIEPMAPSAGDECPFPDLGVTWGAAAITQIAVADGSGVTIRVPHVRAARHIALAIAPSGDRADKAAVNPLRVEARFADGRTYTANLTGNEPALANRATDQMSGTYAIGTVRITLPSWARKTALESIQLSGQAAGAAFDLRAVDVMVRDADASSVFAHENDRGSSHMVSAWQACIVLFLFIGLVAVVLRLRRRDGRRP